MVKKLKEVKGFYVLAMLFILLILPFHIAYSQQESQDIQLFFHKLGVEEGLVSSNALCLLQDHLNRIWVGSIDGLSVYDGHQVRIFQPSATDNNSLLGHHVRKILQIGKSLWILTNSGISKLDLTTLKFSQFPFSNVYTIGTFKEQLLISTGSGVKYLDEESGTFKPSSLFLEHDKSISAFLETPEELYATTHSKKIYRLNKSNLKIEVNTIKELTNVTQISVAQDNIWLSSYDNGALQLNSELKLIKHLHTNAASPYQLKNNSVRTIKTDETGRVWIGTFMGLHIFHPKDSRITFHQSDNSIPGSLPHDSVWDILEDHQGTIWMATYYGGLGYVNPENHLFTRFHHQTASTNRLSHYVLGQMVEDENQNIWIATEGGGLDYYDQKSQKIINYGWFGHPSFKDKNIKSLWLDDDKYLFIGTHEGGLFRLSLSDLQVESIPFQPYHKISITDIKPYKNKLLLASNLGLLSYNTETREFSRFFGEANKDFILPSGTVSLLVDHKERIWLGTKRDGIFRFDPIKKKMDHFQKLNSKLLSNDIFEFFQDSKKRIWIGTLGGGLSLFEEDSANFKTFTRAGNGLPSDLIYGIQESRFDNYWIATNRGLVRFNPENEFFYNFDKESGFPISEINQSSLLLTRNGELYVGGINGLVSFKEQSAVRKCRLEKPYFSQLTLNNQVVQPGKDQVIDVDLPFIKKVTLLPEHTSFNLQFTSSNYLHDKKSKFMYQLVGFDKEWLPGETQSVSYTNLNPGKYQFLVRSFDPQYPQSYLETSLELTITPPFYFSNLAYLIYFMLLVLLIFGINYFYKYRSRLLYEIEFEKKSKGQILINNNQKLEFFTNVAHEFMTPLSIITGTLEGLLEQTKLPKPLFNRIQIACKSSGRLKTLSKELLDFRKLERGHLKLQAYPNDLISFAREVFNSFERIAQDREIQFGIGVSAQKLQLTFDPIQLEKVFYNLLSNSFKQVDQKTGKIRLEIQDDVTAVHIHFIDNGPGIPKEETTKIFDRFYQINNFHRKPGQFGVGIGLALSKGIVESHGGEISVVSEPGENTDFCITLKKGDHHLPADFIVATPAQEIEFSPVDLNWRNELCEPNVSIASDNAAKILLIDDDIDFRDYIKNTLIENFKILEASNGKDGLMIAMKELPDLIISDVFMPEMAGIEFTKRLKRNLHTCHIPLILLTVKSETELRIEGLETGADDYISKLVNPRLLKTRIHNLLKNRTQLLRALEENRQLEMNKETLVQADQEFLQKSKAYVLHNLDKRELNVQVFSREMGLSRTRLFERIKEISGQTPNEFIQRIRLEKSAELISSHPNRSMAQIAEITGFNTARYFSKCFRNHYGCSPRDYARQEDTEGAAKPNINNKA
jgi:signal transduction histidine kinase/ligand-binding sensor domain-containing protein/DNA-binding response OmpR family regulator